MQLEGQKPVTCFQKFGKNYKTKEERKDAIRRSKTRYMLSKISYCEVCDREYCLAGKTQHLKTTKHNKNFLNRPLGLDHLESEDESIETFLNMSHT